jgi:tRNA modification GTPase
MDNAVYKNAVYGDDSPIAAFATLPGKSAITLIRCSGKSCLELADGIFSARQKLKEAAGNTVIHGWIVSPACTSRPGEKIDEVLVSVFRAPKSYTGEDSLDISCHGGTAAGNAVMSALRVAGFRDALPGEFTFRSFMNGKLDLTRCESVMELVSAKTDTGRRHAVSRLSGMLERQINSIKKKIVEVLAASELFLDYSEDEIGIDSMEDSGRLPKKPLAQEALTALQSLLESWQRERIYQDGILAVIAGRPNAGKSSLFNLLLKEERSIVADLPGTTRDWIDAWISIGGIPVRLVDTAGLRVSADIVETAGVERSRNLMQNADLVLYIIDGAEGIAEEDLSFLAGLRQKCITVWNKIDIAAIPPAQSGIELIGISAKTGEGTAKLTAAIAGLAGENPDGERETETGIQEAAIGSARQKGLVETAFLSLKEALDLDSREEPLDIIAPQLREAVNALGEITGEVSTADILEEMFSKFCVGK